MRKKKGKSYWHYINKFSIKPMSFSGNVGFIQRQLLKSSRSWFSVISCDCDLWCSQVAILLFLLVRKLCLVWSCSGIGVGKYSDLMCWFPYFTPFIHVFLFVSLVLSRVHVEKKKRKNYWHNYLMLLMMYRKLSKIGRSRLWHNFLLLLIFWYWFSLCGYLKLLQFK